MTIFVINPNASSSMTTILEQEAAGLLGVHHALRFVTSEQGPASIEGHSDGALAAFHLTQMVRDIESSASSEKASAYVIACFDDTGLDAVRELTTAPVIGIGEAAMHAASFISQRFCIMTTLQRSVPILERNLSQYGLASRCAGVFASGIPVLQLEADPNSYQRLLQASHDALEQHHGEALILGCAGMSHWVTRLETDLGVPVVDGVRSAIKFAEALIDLNLNTSKKLSYQFPEKKPHT
ncbi:aspartate/glutamate racemase family protein [Marinomonas transparens]|uniref:Aspartate/glutamate racemase family protein n=1 Tax=Marinomonas transparens TaxID=2795388 RepID=A0A934JJG4_9GAMM|nr:aspartate/glutamate racemase family protein [Marinomonas transparens]MBJ7537225.1 aspartate/glutamate racemase family protein [Marinomonas transparens]